MSLPNLYLITGIDIREELRERLAVHPIFNMLLGIAFFLIIILLPIILIKKRKDIASVTAFKVLMSLSFLLISFLAFAIATTFTLSYSPLSITRYYWPVEPCFLLIVGGLLGTFAVKTSPRKVLSIFLITFILFNSFARPVMYATEKNGFSYPSFVAKVLKVPDEKYPSNHILTFYSETLAFILAIAKREPNSLFFAQDYPHYLSYLKFEDPSKLRRIPDNDFWQHAYLSEPTKIYWIISNEGCPSICVSKGNFNSDNPWEPIPALTKLPDLQTIFASSSNDTRVMVSELPADYHFDT